MGARETLLPGGHVPHLPLPRLCLSALAACLLSAGPASAAATTRYANRAALPKLSDGTDVTDPCTLDEALTRAQAGDVISLAAGCYDVSAIALPPIALHWVATNPPARPVLTSIGPLPTIALGPGQSGSSFDGIEIDKVQDMAETGVPAPAVQAGVAATVSTAVMTGPVCVDAPDADGLVIDRSSLSSPAGSSCARLGAGSTLRRSTVEPTDDLAPQTPPR